MAPITQKAQDLQTAIFEQLAFAQPITVNQARRRMAERLGYWPGWGWTRERLRQSGLLMPRLEALEHVRCPIHHIWMGSDCAICAGRVDRCPHCGRYKYADEQCSVCYGEEDVDNDA